MNLPAIPKPSTIRQLFPGLLVVVCVVLLAVLSSLTIVVMPPTVFLLGLGSVVIVSYVVLFEKTEWFIAGLILSTAVSYNFWLDHRIEIETYPISVPDVLALVYGVCGVIGWLRARHRLGFDGVVGICLVIWFLYISTVGIGMGMLKDNLAYGTMQEYRLVFYAALAYFATLTVFRPERHLSVVMLGQIAAGLLVSIWQFWITLSGGGLEASQIILETGGGFGRLLRDVGLPGTFAATALVVLVVIQIRAPIILGKARGWAWGLAPVFVAASFLSMTRTVWVSMALSIGLLFLFFVIAGRKVIRLSRLIILVAVFLVVIALVFTMVQILLPEVNHALELAWDMSFSYQDSTFLARLEQPLDTWNFLWNDGWAFFSGLGFGNISTGAVRFGPFTGIHNAYMWYMVIAGLPGLLLFLALWISPVIVYLRLLTRSLEAVTHSYVIVSIINWLVMSVVMLGSPALWTNAALFGMMWGIASVLAKTYAYHRPVSPSKNGNDLQFKIAIKTNIEHS